VGDCRLYVDVDVEGAGLVPEGPGGDQTGLEPGFGELSEVGQIVYYDHRDQGRSDGSTPDRWNHDESADDLAAPCDTLGSVEPVMLGVSYAVRHPGRAGRLILDSGAVRADFDDRLAMFGPLGGSAPVAAAMAFFEEQRAIAAEIGPERCTLEVVPDYGHAVWRDRPDVGLPAIRAFLAG
jgi:proline iminopeptidase